MSTLVTRHFPTLDLRAAVADVDPAARTFELVFSTGAAVVRRDPYTGQQFHEILSMKPEHVRLARLNAGAPLLNTHSAYTLQDQIGVVEEGSARILNGQGVARVRLSRRPEVAPILQDVQDKVIRNVSVGYRVHKYSETAKDGQTHRTAIDWEPLEVSLVPMPADAGAQLRGTNAAPQLFDCVIVTRAAADEVHRTDDERNAWLARQLASLDPSDEPPNGWFVGHRVGDRVQ